MYLRAKIDARVNKKLDLKVDILEDDFVLKGNYV